MGKVLRIIARVIGILAVIAVVALLIAMAFGVVRVSTVASGEASQDRTAVCKLQDITRYNEFVTTFATSEAEEQKHATELQAFSDDLAKRGGYAADPTCRFIEYSAAIASGNADAAQAAVTAIESFSKNGEYPNNQLLDIVSVQSMKDRIEALKSAGQEVDEPLGSG